MFLRADWFPLVVTRNDRIHYINALEAADDGHLAPLVRFFALVQKKWLTEAIGIAREVRADEERLEQMLDAIAEMYTARRTEHQDEIQDLKNTATDLARRARRRFRDVHMKHYGKVAEPRAMELGWTLRVWVL